MITRQIKAGRVAIGGGAAVTVQTMLNRPWHDIEGNVSQAVELEAAGCDILRVAVPTRESVALIPAIKEKIRIPLVADIHFDYRLALEAAAAGADKIRINPGNIGDDSKVKLVADSCRQRRIPIRIGVNGGSLEKHILARHGHPTAEAMLESALYHAEMLERFDFTDIALSLKSSDTGITVKANRLAAEQTGYPLHIGVTEAGTTRMGLLRSAAGIGSLLLDGIGDTIRISLTADPVEEVRAGIDLLRALGKRGGIRFVSCPGCGRTAIDLIMLANKVEQALSGIDADLTVAVMGCAVNGPGEAREADVAVCGGDGSAALYQKGEFVCRLMPEEVLPRLTSLVKELAGGRGNDAGL